MPASQPSQSQAYLICTEWGPQRRIPREQRLAECIPEIPADTRRVWMKVFDQKVVTTCLINNTFANYGLAED
jgi:hypothetical protein